MTEKELKKGSRGEIFKRIWEGGAPAYVARGERIPTSEHARIDVEIKSDGLLVQSEAIDNLEAFFSELDEASETAELLGKSMAKAEEMSLLQLGIVGAREGTPQFGASADPAVKSKGKVVTGVARTSTSILSGLNKAATHYAKVGLNPSQAICMLGTADFYQLINAASDNFIVHRDFGINASIERAIIPSIYGMQIVHNRFYDDVQGLSAAAGVTAPLTGQNNKYWTDATTDVFTKSVGLCLHPDALRTVRALDLQIEMGKPIDYTVMIVKATQAQGHGVLKAEGCVELQTT